MSEPAAILTTRCPKTRGAEFPRTANAWVGACLGLPLVPHPRCWQHCHPPGLWPRWCLRGLHQEVTLSILHHTLLPKGAGRGLPRPLWSTERETKGRMEEEVTYADLRLPPPPAPQQPVRLPWCWAALSLGVLSLLLLLVQIILVGLSFHYLGQQARCTHGSRSMEESPSYGQETVRRQCQFCPAGWLWDAGQCYYFSSFKKSWEQSREDCCSRGAQLVTIRSAATLAFLVRTANVDNFYVGLRLDSSRSGWKWLDGTPLRGAALRCCQKGSDPADHTLIG
ncbi:CD209 antigen-like protein E isoform X2 [Cuculus canorus]|uniref:CD209 antigen-like protein E isoform X2 n=1 Tax=Cuculus canorus TaxID=55661 RepID=UPI0023AA6E57|nr:CD209 antigen-like protein E isoform X2 [Cuculus canorus]